jgi:hypothetical protein
MAMNDAYSPSVHEVLWGLVLLVVTMFFHAQTTLFAITVYKRELGESSAHPSRAAALFGLLLFWLHGRCHASLQCLDVGGSFLDNYFAFMRRLFISLFVPGCVGVLILERIDREKFWAWLFK